MRVAVALEPSTIVRDACIQRFECTFEASWKALKAYLAEVEGVAHASPSQCFRAALRVGLCSPEDAESLLQMTIDRNLTAHTYIEGVTIRIASRLPRYAELIERLLGTMRQRIADSERRLILGTRPTAAGTAALRGRTRSDR